MPTSSLGLFPNGSICPNYPLCKTISFNVPASQLTVEQQVCCTATESMALYLNGPL